MNEKVKVQVVLDRREWYRRGGYDYGTEVQVPVNPDQWRQYIHWNAWNGSEYCSRYGGEMKVYYISPDVFEEWDLGAVTLHKRVIARAQELGFPAEFTIEYDFPASARRKKG